ncbi:hypothetical protein SVIOM74S_04230 [Streptomyces violarus]
MGATGLSGKSVIVTGAASGIGRATALRFAEEGARVVVADLNAAGARASSVPSSPPEERPSPSRAT